jgi:hypothetical protein
MPRLSQCHRVRGDLVNQRGVGDRQKLERTATRLKDAGHDPLFLAAVVFSGAGIHHNEKGSVARGIFGRAGL